MSDISAFLSQYYGNDTQADTRAEVEASEDLYKQAQIELFQKLAHANNIDLASLSQEQVNALWADFQKVASEEPKAEEKKEEKKDDKAEAEKKAQAEIVAAAERELSEKRAAAEKVAEAETLGRIMAHAYVSELKKIASEAKEAGEMPPQFAKKDDDKGEKKDDKKEEKKEEEKKASATVLEVKQASTIDQLAVQVAFNKLAEAGFDTAQAEQRLTAVMVLGPAESTKIAAAQNVEQAVEIRSLELLEAAGYQVNWG